MLFMIVRVKIRRLTNLAQITQTDNASACLLCGRKRRQEKARQDRYDRNNDQKLDQSKCQNRALFHKALNYSPKKVNKESTLALYLYGPSGNGNILIHGSLVITEWVSVPVFGATL
jgi:hypothetical protein